jgi:hypothetical protein
MKIFTHLVKEIVGEVFFSQNVSITISVERYKEYFGVAHGKTL